MRSATIWRITLVDAQNPADEIFVVYGSPARVWLKALAFVLLVPVGYAFDLINNFIHRH